MDYYANFYTAFPFFGVLNAGDTLTIGSAGGLIAPGFTLTDFLGAGVDISISGELRVYTVLLNQHDRMTIGSTGTVTALSPNSGIEIGFGAGVGILNNFGTISDSYGAAVVLNGGNNVVQNGGTINGLYGVIMGFDHHGSDSLNNAGLILTAGTAVQMAGGTDKLVNSGTLQSEDTFSYTIAIQGEVDSIGGLSATVQHIENTGHIMGLGTAIGSDLNQVGSVLILDNSGTISAGAYSIYGSGQANNNIINSGSINGDILLGSGVDVISNVGGRIIGSVDLGNSADVFDNRHGLISGSISGNSGADTYYVDSQVDLVENSNPDRDIVYAAINWRLGTNFEDLTLLEGGNFNGTGNTLSNVITGNSGDNRLTGFDGNDALSGDLGDDKLIGGAGNDSLAGGDGDDLLQGGLSADSLIGLSGDDVLIGGAGFDVMNGGTGADRFVFANTAHSGNTQATADVIQDFTLSDDLIDLSGIDAIKGNANPNDSFTYISGAFTGVAGQVHTLQNGAFTYVEMDVNGDGISDCTIKLSGLLTITAADFVL